MTYEDHIEKIKRDRIGGEEFANTKQKLKAANDLLIKNNICPLCEKHIRPNEGKFGGYAVDLCACDRSVG